MIGVFDSGLGGLNVLKSLVETLPDVDFFYLGDTARLPYGSKSPQTIRKYLEQNIRFLLAHKVEAIVVACNSASSVLESTDDFSVPVYSVIPASARAAVAASLDEKIGVLATRATVESKAYIREINKLSPSVSVFQQACPLLVPLVEEGWSDDPVTNLIVFRYVTPLNQVQVDTVILGCTHYPLLLGAFRKVFGNSVNIISSGEAVAQLLKSDIQNGQLKLQKNSQRQITVFTTDLNSHFQLVAQRLFDPHPISRFELINIS